MDPNQPKDQAKDLDKNKSSTSSTECDRCQENIQKLKKVEEKVKKLKEKMKKLNEEAQKL